MSFSEPQSPESLLPSVAPAEPISISKYADAPLLDIESKHKKIKVSQNFSKARRVRSGSEGLNRRHLKKEKTLYHPPGRFTM